MKKEKIRISRGVTFEGFVSTMGFIFVGVGVLMVLYGEYWIGGASIIVGLVNALRVRSWEFDLSNNRYRMIDHYLFFKVGLWNPKEGLSMLELRYEKEAMGLTFSLVHYRQVVKTFDIILIQKDGMEDLIKDFNNYKDARQFAHRLSEDVGLDLRDTYALRRQSAQIRRKRKKRR